MKKLLWIIPSVLILCLMAGFQQQEEGITSEEARALIDRQLEFWNGGDVDIVDEVIAPEYVIYLDPHDEYEKQTLDRSAYKERVLYGRTFFSDSLYTYEDLIAKGDKITVRWTHIGKSRSTGKPFVVTGLTIYLIEDGRLKGHWQSWDRLGLYLQFDYTLNPPKTPEQLGENK